MVPDGLSTQLMGRTRALEKRFYATGRVLTHATLMLLLSSIAFAQSPSPIDAKPGHGFAAVAPLSMTDDAHDRLSGSRLADESFWLVDATVFVSRNVGIGVEVMPLGSVTRQDRAIFFQGNDAEDEHAVLVMARARILAKRRFALDTVFGGGIAFEHWSFHSDYSGVFPSVITDRTFDEKNPALGIGVDAPLSLIPHVALLPIVRLHLVNHDTEIASNGWSTRVSIGIGAGVKW